MISLFWELPSRACNDKQVISWSMKHLPQIILILSNKRTKFVFYICTLNLETAIYSKLKSRPQIKKLKHPAMIMIKKTTDKKNIQSLAFWLWIVITQSNHIILQNHPWMFIFELAENKLLLVQWDFFSHWF